LVTLLGVGGVGKTRLALRVARQTERAYPDGVWFVELAHVREADLVSYTVAQTLGVQDWSARGVAAVLLDYLKDRTALLVLDNCEQVLDGCARFCADLLSTSPSTRILATSRQPLDVHGEHTLVVAPLPAPAAEGAESHEAVAESDAVRLFAERAAAASPHFTLTPQNEAAVARVCQKLDGVPLAIELAAARTGHISVEDLLTRIGDRFHILGIGKRASAARHRTLRAAVDWSYDLCTPEERKLWTRLSVFVGGVDLSAAEYVCVDEELSEQDFLETIFKLVEKSIISLQRADSRNAESRYHVLETIREYGQSRLGHQERIQLRRRHCEWFQRLASEGADAWFGADQFEWRRRVAAEHANLRAALEFCATEPGYVQMGLRMAGDLWFYWEACGLVAEGRRWLDRLLALDTEPTAARATALWVVSWLASHQGDVTRGAATAAECRRLGEEQGDEALVAFGMHLSGVAAMARGDLGEAHRLCIGAWSRHQRLDQVNCPTVMALVQAGLIADLQGETDAAIDHAEECLRITADAGEAWTQSYGLVALGLAHWCRGEAAQALAPLRDSIAIKYRLNDLFGLGLAVEFLAWSLTSEGGHEEAARLYGCLEQIWPLVGIPLLGSAQLVGYHERSEAATCAALGANRFEKLYREGATRPLEEGLEYIVEGTAVPEKHNAAAVTSARQQPRSPLTRREGQVAELVARGMSNKEIASTLVISVRTVATHVENIFTKLGFRSRAKLAGWITGSGDAPEDTAE
jgi:non-specific serine/threonine protein kinase